MSLTEQQNLVAPVTAPISRKHGSHEDEDYVDDADVRDERGGGGRRMDDDDDDEYDDQQIQGNGYVSRRSIIELYDPREHIHLTVDGRQVDTCNRVWKELIGMIFIVGLFTAITTTSNQLNIILTSKAATYLGASGSFNVTNGNKTEELLISQSYLRMDPMPNIKYEFSGGSNTLVAMTEQGMTIVNPAADVLTALVMSIVLYLAHRAMPGCTFNPWLAVSNHMLQWQATGKPLTRPHIQHSRLQTFLVIVAQFLGSFAAIWLVYMWNQGDSSKLGDTLPTALLAHDSEVLMYEGVGSFFLMLMLTLFSQPMRRVSPSEQTFFIAAIHFILMMALLPFTGGSMNFARTFGSACVHAIVSAKAPPLSLLWYALGQACGFSFATIIAKHINNQFIEAVTYKKTKWTNRLYGSYTRTRRAIDVK